MGELTNAPNPPLTYLAPRLIRPSGLRRFRAALGEALYARCPIICIGDSLTFGQGGDNVNSVADSTQNTTGYAGQLRQLFAKVYGDAGEGFIFANAQSSRVTAGAGANFVQYGPLRKSIRMLNGTGHSITLNVPTGCTSVGIIQANQSGDVSALYSLDGGGAASITTLTGTGTYIETAITVSSGTTHTIVITPPASAQSYITGFTLRNGTVGVPVHRVGTAGYVSGDMLGGQTTGVLNLSAPNQLLAQRAHYQWESPAGLIIIAFGINDQQNQAGSGAAGGVTRTLYRTWVEQFTDQATTDGWCCLLVGSPRNPNAAGSGDSEAAYYAELEAIANTNDHVAYLDMGDVWGTATASGSSGLGLQFASSVHPNRKGHGDYARIIYTALTSPGIIDTAPA